MKTKILLLGTCVATFCIVACNNGQQTAVTTDSSTTSTGTTSGVSNQSATDPTVTTTTTSTTVHLNPSASYVDLRSGKKVKLRVDTVTKYIVNEVTNQPVMYYIDPSTNDTFDRQGRVVNRALIKGSNGDYTVDESLLSAGSNNSGSNMNNDGNKTNSGSNMSAVDSAKSSTSSSSKTGNFKEKMKDDKYKYKDDNTKVKVNGDKSKVKSNQ